MKKYTKKIKRQTKNSPRKTREKIKEATFGLANNIIETILLMIVTVPYILKEPRMSKVMENISIAIDEYDVKRIRRGFYNLKSRKYLDRSNKLTKLGLEKIKSLTPVYSRPDKWDDQWRLVVFDIPEHIRRKRDILRDKLMDLGFGMLQKSIWLSPFDYLEVVKKLVNFYKLNPYVLTTITSNINNQENRALARQVWPLEKINRAYKEFIAKYKKAKKTDLSGKFLYLSILKQDSQLPVELLPKDWQGWEAAKIAKKKKWI